MVLDGFVEQSHVIVVRDVAASTLDIRLERAASDLAILTVEGAPAGAKCGWSTDTWRSARCR